MSRLDPTTEEAATALSSPPTDDPWSLDRRRFLQAAAAGVGVSMMPGWLDGIAGAATPLRADQGVLVLVTLDGGADPLDMFVPIADGNYYQRRGGIVVGATQALHLTGSRGLHPRLGHLRVLLGDGEVAIVDGVGNPKVDLSHFSAMADVQHGGPASGVPKTGWLGRYLDGLGADPLHGVAIGSRVPLVLTGARTVGTTLPSQVDFVRENREHNRTLDAALVAMGSGPTGLGTLADRLAGTTAGMMGVSSQIRPLYGAALGHDPRPPAAPRRQPGQRRPRDPLHHRPPRRLRQPCQAARDARRPDGRARRRPQGLPRHPLGHLREPGAGAVRVRVRSPLSAPTARPARTTAPGRACWRLARASAAGSTARSRR